jgi:hypothetical protein
MPAIASKHNIHRHLANPFVIHKTITLLLKLDKKKSSQLHGATSPSGRRPEIGSEAGEKSNTNVHGSNPLSQLAPKKTEPSNGCVSKFSLP